MHLDLSLTCRLLAGHLDQDGIAASVHGTKLRISRGPELRLRPERRQDAEGPASFFWVDVGGLGLEPAMSLDLSGWGDTPEDCATEAAHGLLTAVVPPVRWLSTAPWSPPSSDAGHVEHVVGSDGRPWTVLVAVPWVVVATYESTESPDQLAADLRQRITATPVATLGALGDKVGMLTAEPRGHWLKIFASRDPKGALSCRIDIDNRTYLDSRPFAETIPWTDAQALQMVRQLVVLRPDDEPSRLQRAKRLRRLLRA